MQSNDKAAPLDDCMLRSKRLCFRLKRFIESSRKMDTNLVFKAYVILQRIGAYLNIFLKKISGFPTEKHDVTAKIFGVEPTSGIF